MKNILIDLTYINPNIMAGVSIYIYRLLNGFVLCHYNENIILLCTHSNIDAIREEVGNSFRFLALDDINISKIPHLRGVLNLYRMNRLMVENKIDLFFLHLSILQDYIHQKFFVLVFFMILKGRI